jgi:hypothetical protein
MPISLTLFASGKKTAPFSKSYCLANTYYYEDYQLNNDILLSFRFSSQRLWYGTLDPVDLIRFFQWVQWEQWEQWEQWVRLQDPHAPESSC